MALDVATEALDRHALVGLERDAGMEVEAMNTRGVREGTAFRMPGVL